MSKVKSKLYISGFKKEDLFGVLLSLKNIFKKKALSIKGPIPFPLKKLYIPCRKSVCGEGSETWDKWEIRIYKFLIMFEPSPDFFKKISNLEIPESVNLKIIL